MHPSIRSFFLCLVSTYYFITLVNVRGLLMRIAHDHTDCIHVSCKPGENLTLAFSAFPEYVSNFAAYVVRRDDRKTVYTLKTGNSGKYVFPSVPKEQTHQPDVYDICFSNKNTFLLNVEFSVRSLENNEGSIATGDKMRQVTVLVGNMHQNVLELMEQLRYMLLNENAHRETAEKTNYYVMWWIVIKAIVIILLVAIQNYYLRSYFEIKLTI